MTLCEKEDDDVSGSPAPEVRSPMIFANYEERPPMIVAGCWQPALLGLGVD